MFLAGHPSQGCFGLQSHCAPCYFFNQASFCPSDFSFSEFRTVIEDDETNCDSEKELSQEQKLELAISKKFQQTKIQYKNQLYPKPSDEKSIYLKMRDLEENTWKKYTAYYEQYYQLA
ncbi:uncharacterized protein TNCV_2123611 [Trichonephila clavipes]|nr:uncharacterized protein TNCV_2123611 [Trichonephila clavipes]